MANNNGNGSKLIHNVYETTVNYFIHTVIPIQIHETENTGKKSALSCSSITAMV